MNDEQWKVFINATYWRWIRKEGITPERCAQTDEQCDTCMFFFPLEGGPTGLGSFGACGNPQSTHDHTLHNKHFCCAVWQSFGKDDNPLWFLVEAT